MNSQLLLVLGLLLMTSIAFARPGMLKFAYIYTVTRLFLSHLHRGQRDVVNSTGELDRIRNYCIIETQLFKSIQSIHIRSLKAVMLYLIVRLGAARFLPEYKVNKEQVYYILLVEHELTVIIQVQEKHALWFC